jgi:hypothetical protein
VVTAALVGGVAMDCVVATLVTTAAVDGVTVVAGPAVLGAALVTGTDVAMVAAGTVLAGAVVAEDDTDTWGELEQATNRPTATSAPVRRGSARRGRIMR